MAVEQRGGDQARLLRLTTKPTTTATTSIVASGSHANGREELPEPLSDSALARRTPGIV